MLPHHKLSKKIIFKGYRLLFFNGNSFMATIQFIIYKIRHKQWHLVFIVHFSVTQKELILNQFLQAKNCVKAFQLQA